MAVDREIMFHVDTLANLISTLKNKQRGLASDVTGHSETPWNLTNGLITWKNNANQLIVGAIQKYYNGAAWVRVGNVFADIEADEIYTDTGFKDQYLAAAIPLSETGETALDPNFTATSIIGALNELENNALLWSRDIPNTETYLTNTGDDVGIGTVDPSEILHIVRNQAAVTTTLMDNSTAAGASQFSVKSDSCQGYFAAYSSTYAGNTELQDKVSVYADTLSTSLALISSKADGVIQFYTGGAASGNKRVTIDSTGKVGIGTDSIEGFVHILESSAGSITSVQSLIIERTSGVGLALLTDDSNQAEIHFGCPTSEKRGLLRYRMPSDTPADMFSIYTAGEECFFINSSGQLGIDNSDPFLNIATASGDLAAGTGIHIECATADTDGACLILEDTKPVNGSANGAHIYMGGSSGIVAMRAYDHDSLLLGGCEDDLSYLYDDAHIEFGWNSIATGEFAFLTIRNKANAVSMDDTRTSILFEQFYYDAVTPNNVNSGRITVGTEGNWTSTASTQDSYMSFFTAKNGTLNERLKIDSYTEVEIVTLGEDNALTLTCYGFIGTESSILNFRKSDSNTAELHITDNGEYLGIINFTGVDTGYTWAEAIQIRGEQNGSATATNCPADLIFFTNAGSSLNEVMRLTKDKTLDIGNNNIHGSTIDLADDTAGSITPSQADGMMMIFCMNTGISAIISYSINAGVAYCRMISDTGQFEVTTGALLGTTGTDGKYTLSYHTDNKIYFENRLGSN